MSWKASFPSLRGQVPHGNGVVVRCCVERFAITREQTRSRSQRRTDERASQGQRTEVPEPGRRANFSGGEQLALGREGSELRGLLDGCRNFALSQQGLGNRPEPNRAVAARARKGPAIGREPDRA